MDTAMRVISKEKENCKNSYFKHRVTQKKNARANPNSAAAQAQTPWEREGEGTDFERESNTEWRSEREEDGMVVVTREGGRRGAEGEDGGGHGGGVVVERDAEGQMTEEI